METPPHSSPLIPATIPQAAPPSRPRVERQAGPLVVYNGPSRTPQQSTTMPREARVRLDAHASMRLQAEQALGLLSYPLTFPREKRAELALAIANKVMHQVPLGAVLPGELRLFCVRASRGITLGGPAEGITFNVAAWPLESPPPVRPVNPDPDAAAWYPHDPLSLGGTEPVLEQAPIRFSGRFLIRTRRLR